ncbi:hypothetical protein WMY93_010249 [Mugilogobius chulae]|uniref:Uncharacterized protein n=1 Tax=Mugilogobius chulae TaxID=88201 RepID=A0AAW0P7B4_9GOBI
MPLSAYMSPHSQDALEDLGDALSDLEKKLCQHFRRLEIAGKRGRKVPVLLTPAMQEALDLLVSKREMCGVVPGNKYLFARPKACSYFRGSDCLRHFAKMCGAKNPESLTSTKLRKQTATLSQVLNLSNTELDQLADFLGHDVRVHRQFYRLPEGTLQLAKVSKILMALEQGRMAEFKGKGLDDITIDPEDENQNIEEDLDAEMPDETNETSQPTGHGREVLSDHTTLQPGPLGCQIGVCCPLEGIRGSAKTPPEIVHTTTVQPTKSCFCCWAHTQQTSGCLDRPLTPLGTPLEPPETRILASMDTETIYGHYRAVIDSISKTSRLIGGQSGHTHELTETGYILTKGESCGLTGDEEKEEGGMERENSEWQLSRACGRAEQQVAPVLLLLLLLGPQTSRPGPHLRPPPTCSTTPTTPLTASTTMETATPAPAPTRTRRCVGRLTVT